MEQEKAMKLPCCGIQKQIIMDEIDRIAKKHKENKGNITRNNIKIQKKALKIPRASLKTAKRVDKAIFL